MSFLSGDNFDKGDLLIHLLHCINECQIVYSRGDKHATELDRSISNLCKLLELIFLNGVRLKPLSISKSSLTPTDTLQQFLHLNFKLGYVSESSNAWMFVKHFLTKQEQERFALLENVYTYKGLLRAWIRSSLNEKTLNKYVEQMLQNDNLLVTFYCDDAFIRGKENMNILPNMIMGLNSISFTMGIDSTELNEGKKIADEPVIECKLPGKRDIIPNLIDSQLEIEEEKESKSSYFDDNCSQSSSISFDNESLSYHIYQNLRTLNDGDESNHCLMTRKCSSDHNHSHDSLNSVHEVVEVASDISAVITALEEKQDFQLKQLQCKINHLQLENSKLYEQLPKCLRKSRDNIADEEITTKGFYNVDNLFKDYSELIEMNSRLQKIIEEKDAIIEKYQQDLHVIEWSVVNQRTESFPNSVSVWIPSAFLTGSGSKSHHVYQIYIKAGDDDWNIYRRYSQFYSLHSNLKKIDSVVSTFQFPPKKKIGNKDNSVVENRRFKLQNYLRKIISHWPELSKCNNRSSLEHKLDFFKDSFTTESTWHVKMLKALYSAKLELLSPFPLKMCSNQDNFYLGLDLSSQKLKGIIIDDDLCIVDKQEVDFDVELAEFGTVNGFLQSNLNDSVTAEVSAPVLMWVKALDLLMEKFQSNCNCLTIFQIKAISGCAQQHGTVYWKKNQLDSLQNPDSSITLYEKLKNSFSINKTPVWRDSSTKAYCNLMEHAVGGKEVMAKITGSVCNARFSGPQIMKIVKERHHVYINTEKICLISNFLCSLFLGKYAPFEIADASGMNLVDIRTKQWHFDLLNCIDVGLHNKLGQIQTNISECGTISEYFCNRYNFQNDCRIFSFTGDNLSSFAGLRANQNTIVLSLGTSDTVLLYLTDPVVVQEGHVFCNPVNPSTYIGLLCFKNGSLVRQRFCNTFANGSWEIFDNLLGRNEPGNGCYLGLFYDDFEIVPVYVKGDYRYDKFHNRISKFPNAQTEIRAVIEGQIIAKKYHILNSFQCKIDRDTQIFVTGGASVNHHIVQIVADVFQCKVYQKSETNSAALGACYIAKFAYDNQLSKIMECDHCHDNDIIFTPNESYANCYNEMLKQYEKILTGFQT